MVKNLRYSQLEAIEFVIDARDIARWLRDYAKVPEDFVLCGETDVEWPIKMSFERITPSGDEKP